MTKRNFLNVEKTMDDNGKRMVKTCNILAEAKQGRTTGESKKKISHEMRSIKDIVPTLENVSSKISSKRSNASLKISPRLKPRPGTLTATSKGDKDPLHYSESTCSKNSEKASSREKITQQRTLKESRVLQVLEEIIKSTPLEKKVDRNTKNVVNCYRFQAETNFPRLERLIEPTSIKEETKIHEEEPTRDIDSSQLVKNRPEVRETFHENNSKQQLIEKLPERPLTPSVLSTDFVPFSVTNVKENNTDARIGANLEISQKNTDSSFISVASISCMAEFSSSSDCTEKIESSKYCQTSLNSIPSLNISNTEQKDEKSRKYDNLQVRFADRTEDHHKYSNEKSNDPSVVREEISNEPSVCKEQRSKILSVVKEEVSNNSSVVRKEISNEPSVCEEERSKNSSIIREEISNNPSVVREEKSKKASVFREERSKKLSVVREVISNNPSIVREEILNEPSVCKEERSKNSSIVREEISNNPSVVREEKSKKASVFREERSKNLSVVKEEISNNPSIVREEISYYPSICKHERSKNLSVVREETSNDPSVGKEEIFNKPSVCKEEKRENQSVVREKMSNNSPVVKKEIFKKPSISRKERSENPSVIREEMSNDLSIVKEEKSRMNPHSLSLTVLKEFLCSQGIDVNLVNKAEQCLKDKQKIQKCLKKKFTSSVDLSSVRANKNSETTLQNEYHRKDKLDKVVESYEEDSVNQEQRLKDIGKPPPERSDASTCPVKNNTDASSQTVIQWKTTKSLQTIPEKSTTVPVKQETIQTQTETSSVKHVASECREKTPKQITNSTNKSKSVFSMTDSLLITDNFTETLKVPYISKSVITEHVDCVQSNDFTKNMEETSHENFKETSRQNFKETSYQNSNNSPAIPIEVRHEEHSERTIPVDDRGSTNRYHHEFIRSLNQIQQYRDESSTNCDQNTKECELRIVEPDVLVSSSSDLSFENSKNHDHDVSADKQSNELPLKLVSSETIAALQVAAIQARNVHKAISIYKENLKGKLKKLENRTKLRLQREKVERRKTESCKEILNSLFESNSIDVITLKSCDRFNEDIVEASEVFKRAEVASASSKESIDRRQEFNRKISESIPATAVNISFDENVFNEIDLKTPETSSSVVLKDVRSLMEFLVHETESQRIYYVQKVKNVARPRFRKRVSKMESSGKACNQFSVFSRENVLPLVYGVVCSVVFWCLQFSITCDIIA